MPFHPVKHFMSGKSGAPDLYGQPGQGLAVLRACLIEGFNPRVIASITITDGVATAEVPNGHGYTELDILLLGGCNEAAWNDEFTIRNVTTTTFQFDAPGATPPTPAAGDIQARVAPVGYWEEVFTGTNKAVFRSTHPDATGLYLRVDDTDARYMRVRGYEAMTDVDTGTGPFPTFAQVANGAYTWVKSDAASTATRPWVLIADAMWFGLFAAWRPDRTGSDVAHFGDAVSYKAGDSYHCMIHAQTTSTPTYPYSSQSFYSLGDTSGRYLARAATQIGSAVSHSLCGSSVSDPMGDQALTYPSPADGALLLHMPIGVVVSGGLRGVFPGLLQPMQTLPAADRDIVDDVPDLLGRRLMFLRLSRSATYQSCIAFDITGPWR